MEDSFKFRMRVIFLGILFFGVILITRLFFIQVVKSDFYENQASRQYFAPAADNFDRGSIYFSEKNGNLISAAVVRKGFLLAVNTKLLKDPEAVYQKISSIIQVDKDYFMSRALKEDDPYEVVARRLEPDSAQKIKDLRIPGLILEQELWRYYPSKNLASPVLGFVGYKDDKLTGRYGLELSYDPVLKKDNGDKAINSFAEIFLDIKKLISGGFGSGDVVLTIEPTVQSLLEKQLDKLIEKYKAQLAGGIIINPKTGEIIAMSSKPDFDPNNYSKVKNFSVFMNPNVESVFEMGSIMKSLTMAAALDSGSVTAETTYFDKGYVDFGSARIKNHDEKGRGEVNMQKVLNDSLNTGAVFAMQKMGKDLFRQYFVNYGLGEKTDIELPEEASGKISNIVDNKRDLEYATASFGQGIAVTPIEMAVALSSLANGGYIMKPYIVKEVDIKGLTDRKREPQLIRQVLKKETSEEISRMLVNVADEALVGGKYKNDHYSIAAKTGTAQVVVKGQKSYSEGSYVHTFFGYGPAFDAKFLIILFLSKPQGVKYAAYSLTEPFMDMAKFLLNYYEIPPDR